MERDVNRLFTDPEDYGVQNPEAPGEPPPNQPASTPVPGTGYERKQEHKREHDAEGNVPKTPDGGHPHETIQHG